MGNDSSFQQESDQQNKCKLFSQMPITSQIQQEYMRQILLKRSSVFHNQFICTVKHFNIVQQESRSRMSCEQSKKLVIYYQNFDYSLADISLESYQFTTQDIYSFIYCIVEALLSFRKNKINHGDISFRNIVSKGNNWQLVDKVFIRNGINAYERVLQGEQGFISPTQMQKIRHGFIRQSPQIQESDDIFSLGMIALQLASRKLSKKCYRQSFIRFHENIIQDHLKIVYNLHTPEIANIISSMLQFSESSRISLDGLIRHPLIANANKFSLKQKLSANNSGLKKSFINESVHSRSLSGSKPQTANSLRLSGARTNFDYPQNFNQNFNKNTACSQRLSQYYYPSQQVPKKELSKHYQK